MTRAQALLVALTAGAATVYDPCVFALPAVACVSVALIACAFFPV